MIWYYVAVTAVTTTKDQDNFDKGTLSSFQMLPMFDFLFENFVIYLA